VSSSSSSSSGRISKEFKYLYLMETIGGLIFWAGVIAFFYSRSELKKQPVSKKFENLKKLGLVLIFAGIFMVMLFSTELGQTVLQGGPSV